jgi:hypothetical protein
MIYERRDHRPLSRRSFAGRMARHFGVVLLLVAGSLAIGMAGYMGFEHLAWRDAFLNSAMLLGGMGPVDAPKSDGGKLFAGLYALYCGLVVIITASVIFAPVLHRVMHKFHWKESSK